MNCEQINQLMQDYIDRRLSNEVMDALREHMQVCTACNADHDAFVNVREQLQSISIPPHSEGFADRVLAQATKPAKGERYRAVPKVIGGSLAAGLLVFWLISVSTLPSAPGEPGVTASDIYHVAVNDEVKTIKVAIDSNAALEGVNMRIELTPNLQLSGFTGRQQVDWNTSFRKGVNILSLPIVGLASGDGEIITSVRVNGKNKVMRIKTSYRNGNATHSIQTLTYS